MKKIALAVLAAGASRRFGDDDKLLAAWHGRPLLSQTLAIFQSIQFERKLAIVRDRASAIGGVCGDAGFDVLENKSADSGLASSIGLAATACASADGLMIALGDMPAISPNTIDAIISAFDNAAGDAITAPTIQNRRGHPVIFSTVHVPALSSLKGDRGASAVIENHLSVFVSVPVDDAGIFADFDRPDDFRDTASKEV